MGSSTMNRIAESSRRGGYLALHFLRSLLGDKRPLLGGIKLTHDCNLSCTQCPFRMRKGDSLSFAKVLSSLTSLYDWGVRILMLEGGEPFLWEDGSRRLNDVVGEAKKLFFAVGVTTNGTLPIEVDSDIVWVSIDGLRDTHDRLRGKSFDRIIANIQSSSHPKIYAHITINSINWEEIPELVRYLSDKVKAITFQFYYPFQETGRELVLPNRERHEVLDGLLDMKREGWPIAVSGACLRALKRNRWRCRPWMIASVDPDGQLHPWMLHQESRYSIL